MNQFIKPPYENLEWGRYKDFINKPVNLANVNGIAKIKKRYYPDNDGCPGINFLGTETKSLEDGIVWIFKNEKERDDCFEAIANNSFNVVNILNTKDIFNFKDDI